MFELASEGGGYFSGVVACSRAGDLYRYRLDGGECFPDPASRFQPDGPFGPSQVVDPDRFSWSDAGWRGPDLAGQVIYEMHVGTFTAEGTWQAASRHLERLADLGVSLLEVMPVAEFPGRFDWGYDGVFIFAPSHCYGQPDDFRSFVDRAHGLGMGVILDVVYNHLGSLGDCLGAYAEEYRHSDLQTEWGPAFNFDGPGSEAVRQFFLDNAAYWIRDFHLDGVRLDAIQEFHDSSDEHIVAAITGRIREAAGDRAVLVIGEDEPQEASMLRPVEEGGYGLDALWNDDFHHACVAAVTGWGEAYYGDVLGSAQEFVSLWKYGYLYQGQRNVRQGKPRGQPTRGLPLRSFVTYLENHDQVANSLRGERLHQSVSPPLRRAATALLLLSPGTPMLFQGQEFSSTSPFHYFNDAERQGQELRESRRRFLSQFPSLATEEARAAIPVPTDPEIFRASKLKDAERGSAPQSFALHRDLIRLRRGDPVLGLQRSVEIDGAVLGPRAFVLRYFDEEGLDRLILANLGRDVLYSPVSEPLLAPPLGRDWRLLWSSESVAYGGDGTPSPQDDAGWRLRRASVVVLEAAPRPEDGSS